MHDIDRGGNTTAVRLAALAALRKAQADGDLWGGDEAKPANALRNARRRGQHPRPPQDGSKETAANAAPRVAPDGSAGVFAAVEAAVRKSRVEFISRLVEYRTTLDCDTFGSGVQTPDASMDEAQFIAHRISGVGKTLGFGDLGDAARQTEAAITAWKLERTQERKKTSISRICNLAGLIEEICANDDDCHA